MSDIFDHCFDAYESLGNDGWPSAEDSGYSYNRNFYHTEIDFNLKHETNKAYLITFNEVDFWIPKKICRESKVKGKILVHTSTFNKILGKKL